MKRILIAGTAALALVFGTPLAGTAAPPDRAPAAAGWVTQIGTYDYLTQPDYDGLAPLRVALREAPGERPTIGLGTFDQLDGELVMLGGDVYRVGTDGAPRIARLSRETPFLQAVRFKPQASIRIAAGTECSSLVSLIDDLAGTTNAMVVVRLTGTFQTLTARSVARQSTPYPPLADVVAAQVVFPLEDVQATLVGFRTGDDLRGIGAPGLHLHGLTTARDAGGHILGCTAGPDVKLSIQRTRGVRVLTAP